MMLDPNIRSSQEVSDQWKAQLSAFESVKPTEVVPWDQASWTKIKETYKVTLDTTMTDASKNEVIPYYGFEKGINVRWVTIVKGEDKLWRISGIGTGP
jgi:hypothetical protein